MRRYGSRVCCRVVTPMCFESHAFQVLAKAMADLPKYATNSLRRFPSLHDYYKKENGGEIFRTMTTVADELINEVLKNFTNKTPMCESNTSSHEDNELESDSETPRRKFSASKTWKLHDYTQLARRNQADSALIGRLLRTASYVFTNHSANIVALLLHCTDPSDEQTVTSIVTFHRMCVLIFLRLWAEDIDQIKSFMVHHVPHKTRKLQTLPSMTIRHN